jgi:hypothetical protein
VFYYVNLKVLPTFFLSIGYNMSWVQLGADIDGEAPGDNSGISVSMSADGTKVAIGAQFNNGNGLSSGQVRVYQWNGSSWVQLGADIDGEAADDQSGYSISMSADGTKVAIGANLNNGNGSDRGHVRVYQLNGSAWVQLGADIDGEANNDESGYSVSMNEDGTKVAIGAPFNDGSNRGHVRVYQWNGSAWVKLGEDIDGEDNNDWSGTSVSMSADGTTVAIGAMNNDGTTTDSNRGHVRVYQWNESAWVQLGADIDGENNNDWSGTSVSMSADGTTVAIGAINNDGTTTDSDRGHVRVYQWNGSAWVQLGADIDGEDNYDQSGYSVSMNEDGTKVAIGAPYNDGTGSDRGHVRVYQWNGSAWVQLGADIDGEDAGDWSGRAVSMSADGTKVAIGAIYNDGTTGSNRGHVRVYEFPTTVTSQPTYKPITVNLNVTVDASGTIEVFGASGEPVSNVIVSQTTMPVDALYDGSGGLIEFWEPSSDIGNITVGLYNTVAGGYQATAKKLAAGFHKVLSHAFDCSGATPYSGSYTQSQYYTHSDFGRVALSTYAHYLFGHAAATAAITNDVPFMKNILSLRDVSGELAVSATGVAGDRVAAWKYQGMVDASNVQQWDTTFSPTDANLAVRLAYEVVSKGFNLDGSLNVSYVNSATTSSLANIVKQVIGQDASRAMGQDNNQLTPDIKQRLRFYADDVIYVQIKLPKPSVTVPGGQQVTATSLQDSFTETTYTLKITLGGSSE